MNSRDRDKLDPVESLMWIGLFALVAVVIAGVLTGCSASPTAAAPAVRLEPLDSAASHTATRQTSRFLRPCSTLDDWPTLQSMTIPAPDFYRDGCCEDPYLSQYPYCWM